MNILENEQISVNSSLPPDKLFFLQT